MFRILHFSFLFSTITYSQGLINNGAQIVITNTSHIVVNGATGNYTNQNSGLITNASAGGTITVHGNWSNNTSNVAFSNDGSTVRLSGGNQTIGGTNSTTFYHLNLLGTGTKTLAVNTTVGGISTLTGVLSLGTRPLDLNSRTLTITNPATTAISNSTGFVISETNAAVNPSIVQWNMGTTTGAHVYPFGVSGTLIPFTFNKTTAGAANISVSTRATSSSNNTPWAGVSSVAAVNTMASNVLNLPDASAISVIDRWWDITASAAVTANLVFSYRGSENTTTLSPTGNFSAQHWNGSSWDTQVGLGTGVTSGVGTVSVTGASSFSPWILSNAINGPLPVVMSSLSTLCEKEGVLVYWTTESEYNSQRFKIEKSRDLVHWSFVGERIAAGNSNQTLHYSFLDPNGNDENYYRLLQEDYDGKTTQYGPIHSGCTFTTPNLFAYPNPTKGTFSIEITSMEEEEEISIEIINPHGQIVELRKENLTQGSNNILFQDSEIFASGIYFVRVRSKANFDPIKLMVE